MPITVDLNLAHTRHLQAIQQAEAKFDATLALLTREWQKNPHACLDYSAARKTLIDDIERADRALAETLAQD